MKDEILSILNMEDILKKYNIEINHQMFHCPFHEDKNPSAKMYKKTFYCFSCNRTGDIIQFVQYLYNISFKEAMQKINQDFNLQLKSNYKLDKKKIEEIEIKRLNEQKIKERKRLNFIKLCKLKDIYQNLIDKYNKKIDIYNWEDMTVVISYLQNRVELLDIYICDKFDIDY